MLIFLLNALKVIFVLGFLVLIHEGGHFTVAKLCKVTVNEFSIGFGPVIWKKQGKETKYTIRLIPLGGFVNLEGEEGNSEKEGSFSKASSLKKMAIIVAGALVNIIFAVIVYYGLMLSTNKHMSFKVEDFAPLYNIEESQLQKDDEILEVNNKKIYTKTDLEKVISQSNGENLNLTVKRNNEILQNVKVKLVKQEYKNTGIYLKATKEDEGLTKILTIEAKSPAEQVGIKPNDVILKVNGKDVKNRTRNSRIDTKYNRR